MMGTREQQIDPEVLQAARDWSHSIQVRLAEKLSGEIARDAVSEDVLTGPHRAKVKALLVEAGLDEADAEHALDTHASAKVSELDDPRTRDAIEHTLDSVFKVMGILQMPDISGIVLVSSLATGAVNALVAKNTWNPIIHIFVDADLLIFCASVSKILSQCLSDGTGQLLSRSEMAKRIAAPEMQHATKDLFRAATLRGSVRASKPFLVPPHLMSEQYTLTQSMGAFVLGHEIAHVVLGHIDNDASSGQVLVAEVPDANVLLFSQDAELEADALGTMLAASTAHAQEGSPLLVLASSYIFMRALRALEGCQSIVGRKDGRLDSTHPPASLRALLIRDVLATKLPASPELVPVLDRLDEFFNALESLVVADIQLLTSVGITPLKREMLRMFEERPAILG